MNHFEELVNTSLIVDEDRRHLRRFFKRRTANLNEPSTFSEPATKTERPDIETDTAEQPTTSNELRGT
jgi:hypothetical protein